MRKFIVAKEDAGKRIDRFLSKALPTLPFTVLSITFRKRDVKVNGTRVKENYLLHGGDVIELFIADHILDGYRMEHKISIVYEDPHIVIIDKPAGLLAEGDDKESAEKAIQALFANREVSPPHGFPALCHRLDRNTAGLLLFANHPTALNILLEKFKERQIQKTYQCVVCGCPQKKNATLKAFLLKDPKHSTVKIFHHEIRGSVPIQTNYHVLETNSELSLLDVELVTGRTHQIRAHLAWLGHPIVGDGKYGINTINRQYGFKQQLLWSTSLQFNFTTDAGPLNYLQGKLFQLPRKKLSDIINR